MTSSTLFSLRPETEIEFALAYKTQTKYGDWLDALHPFWPVFLSDTLFGWSIMNPRLTPLAQGASLAAEP